jgi:hypothetical protein
MSVKPPPIHLKTDEYRWSAAAKCPRWCVLGRRGADAAHPTARRSRIMRRGKLFEDLVAEQFEAAYPDGVIRQKEVVWPGGILHTDLYVISEQTAIEVKCSTSPSSLRDSALLQNAGEQMFDGDVTRGGLVWLDPVALEQTLEPVVLTDELKGRVNQVLEQLTWAEDTGGLPDCVCKSPGGCREMGCPFTDVAWEGWEPPEFFPLDGRKAELVHELYYAARDKRENAAVAKSADARCKEIQAELLELGVEPGKRYQVGPLMVTPSPVKGRKTFSVTSAEKNGVWTAEDEERFGAFIKNGDGHVRWAVERLGEEPILTAEDFGDVPF